MPYSRVASNARTSPHNTMTSRRFRGHRREAARWRGSPSKGEARGGRKLLRCVLGKQRAGVPRGPLVSPIAAPACMDRPKPPSLRGIAVGGLGVFGQNPRSPACINNNLDNPPPFGRIALEVRLCVVLLASSVWFSWPAEPSRSPAAAAVVVEVPDTAAPQEGALAGHSLLAPAAAHRRRDARSRELAALPRGERNHSSMNISADGRAAERDLDYLQQDLRPRQAFRGADSRLLRKPCRSPHRLASCR